MPVVTGNFAALLTPGFRQIFGDTYDAYEEEFSKVFEIESSSRAYEEDHSITSLGLLVEKPQAQPISYDTAYDGYTKRYTHTTWALGFSVSREMVEDDLYRKMRNMPRALALSARETVEIVNANILNRAFDSAFVGGDGKPLCANDHPLFGGGGTFSNIPSVPSDLDITSYEQALIDIQMNFLDDRGLKRKFLPQKLIIHPSNLFQAQMILRSAQLPDTANNNFNPAQGTMPGGIVVMHYLTDPDAWFIKTNCPNGLIHFWRRRAEFAQDNDFDAEVAKYKATMRFSSGWTDPRCIYGSAGA